MTNDNDNKLVTMIIVMNFFNEMPTMIMIMIKKNDNDSHIMTNDNDYHNEYRSYKTKKTILPSYGPHDHLQRVTLYFGVFILV